MMGLGRKKGKRKRQTKKGGKGTRNENGRNETEVSTKAVGDEASPANWDWSLVGISSRLPFFGAGAELARAQCEYLGLLHPCPHTSGPIEHTQRR